MRIALSCGLRCGRAVTLAVGVGVVCLLGLTASARAATHTVTSTSDSGPGSLRAVIAAADGGDTIVFDPSLDGQTINLTSGAIAIADSLTIDGPGASQLTINAGHSSQIFTVIDGDLSISGLTLADGAAPAAGGAIADTSAGSLTVSDCAFTGNTAGGHGGGADSSNQGHGGAIYASPSSGSVSVSESTFSANAAGGEGGTGFESGLGSGGAIWSASPESLTVSDSTFTGNTAGGDGDGGERSGNGAGGAIQKSGGLSLTVSDSEFTGNTAGGAGGSANNSGHGFGGAIYVSQPSPPSTSLSITDSSFSGNTAGGAGGDGPGSGPGEGGAIADYGGGSLTVSGAIFAGNGAGGPGGAGGAGLFGRGSGEGHGGAIFVSEFATSTSVSTSAFTGNTAGGDGGGGNLSGRGEGGAIKGDSGTGPLTVTGSTFTDNAAGGQDGGSGGSGGGNGGAINSFSSLTVTDSAFTANAAGGQGEGGTGGAFGIGGAIHNFSNADPLTVSGSTFAANTAGGDGGTGNGGAIHVSAVSPRSAFVSNSTLVGNAAGGGGAAGHGGAIDVTDMSSVTLASVTIDANAVGAGGAGAGINSATGAISRAAAVTARATIVSQNTGAPNCDAPVATSSYSLEGPSSSDTSCGFDLPSADPQLQPLADNGGPTETQALPSSSPAVDAVPVADCPTGTDQRGEPRPDFGKPFCDVGAFELQGPVIAPAITSDAAATFQVGIASNFTVTATGVPTPFLSETGALPSGVGFTDEGDGTASLAGTLAADTGGVYSLTIEASNGVSPDASQSFTLTVQAPPTVSIATPAGGATYALGQVVHTSFACAEGAGGPGIASCTDQDGRRSGAALGTATPGRHTFAVTAASKDGLIASASTSYTVIAPAALRAAIKTKRARVVRGRTKLKVACSGGATGSVCRGVLSLRVPKRTVRRVLHRRTTIVLARTRYTVASGHRRRVALRLTCAGLRLLKHARHRRLRVRAKATVTGGRGPPPAIVLRLKPSWPDALAQRRCPPSVGGLALDQRSSHAQWS